MAKAKVNDQKVGHIDLKRVHKAKYNPRTMGAASKEALKGSLKTFSDISGIVVNQTTGNILSGNHRWEQLCNIYGESTIHIVPVYGEFNAVMSDADFTGFMMRVVNWEIEKEKAANVAANSPMIAGEFTSDLQSVLMDIQDYKGIDFDELRFDDLSLDLGDLASIGNSGIEDPEKLTDKIRKDSEDDNRMVDVNAESPGDVKIIKTSIKLLVPGEKADMIREDILEFLENRPYCDEIEVS